jgi:hypothetical protein
MGERKATEDPRRALRVLRMTNEILVLLLAHLTYSLEIERKRPGLSAPA